MKNLLAHPLTRGLALDDPATTALRSRIIREKAFLRQLYLEWYQRMLQRIPKAETCPGRVLELGSGGGFLKELLPECISSEVFPAPGLDLVLNGQALPFVDKSLRAIVMVDVLHHIPDVGAFFAEAERTLNNGGCMVMLEPWNTAWGRFVYSKLHHEPFLPQRPNWDLPELEGKDGPLSRANGALPWIIFSRDISLFKKSFPGLEVEDIALDYPFSYLASGGVSMRSLAPGWSFAALRLLERLMRPFMHHAAMFAFIVVRKTSAAKNVPGRTISL